MDPQSSDEFQRSAWKHLNYLACDGRKKHEGKDEPEQVRAAMHRIGRGCIRDTAGLLSHLVQRSAHPNWTTKALTILNGLFWTDNEEPTSNVTSSLYCQALIANGLPEVLAQLIQGPALTLGRLHAIQVLDNFVMDSVECRDVMLALEVDDTLVTSFSTVNTESDIGHQVIAAGMETLVSIACHHSESHPLSTQRVQSYFPCFFYGLSRADTCPEALCTFQLLTKDDTVDSRRNLQLMLGMGAMKWVFGWIDRATDHITVYNALLVLNNVARMEPVLMYDFMRTLVHGGWDRLHYGLSHVRSSVQFAGAVLLATLCKHPPSLVLAMEHGVFQVCMERLSSPRRSDQGRKVVRWIFRTMRHVMESVDARSRQAILDMGLIEALCTLHLRKYLTRHVRRQVGELIEVLDPVGPSGLEAKELSTSMDDPCAALPMAESLSSRSVLGCDSYMGSDRMGPIRHARRTQALQSLLQPHPYTRPCKTATFHATEGAILDNTTDDVVGSLPLLWTP